MRVVLDTNIFVSAFVIPGSFAEKAILRIIEGIRIQESARGRGETEKRKCKV